MLLCSFYTFIDLLIIKFHTSAQTETSICRLWSNNLIRFLKFSSLYSKRWPKTSEQMMLETTLLRKRWGASGLPAQIYPYLMWKWQILCKTLDFRVLSLVTFTFVATENVGAVCELIGDDRFEWLLAKSEQSEGWKCETPLLLPQVAITGNDAWWMNKQNKMTSTFNLNHWKRIIFILKPLFNFNYEKKLFQKMFSGLYSMWNYAKDILLPFPPSA